MKKSVKIAIGCFIGLMCVNGCLHRGDAPKEKPQQKVEQQSQVETVTLSTITYNYTNGFVGTVYSYGDKKIDRDKEYNVEGIGKLTGAQIFEMCTDEKIVDVDGNPVIVNDIHEINHIESGKDYYIWSPIVSGELAGSPAVKWGENVITFDCDENTLDDTEIIKVHCDFIVKNIAMNNLVCHMNVLETATVQE